MFPRFYRKLKKSSWYTQHETLLEGKWDQWISMETEDVWEEIYPVKICTYTTITSCPKLPCYHGLLHS